MRALIQDRSIAVSRASSQTRFGKHESKAHSESFPADWPDWLKAEWREMNKALEEHPKRMAAIEAADIRSRKIDAAVCGSAAAISGIVALATGMYPLLIVTGLLGLAAPFLRYARTSV